MRKVLALSLLTLLAGHVQGATIIYTDETLFAAQLQSPYYVEDFTGISSSLPPTQDFGPVNGYSFRAHANNGLWGNPDALSTFSPRDILQLSFTGSAVNAAGGIFTATDDVGGTVEQQTLKLELSDGTLQSVSTTGFVGFISDSAITWLEVSSDAVSPTFFPQADHLYSGVSVPEPALIGAISIASTGLLLRKRSGASRGK